MSSNNSKLKAVLLGKYYLLDMISLGTTSEIYRAKPIENSSRDFFVAIKKVLSSLTDNEEFINGLTVEARISSLINHPSVIDVYEFIKYKDECFIVMELADGKDLRICSEQIKRSKIKFDSIDASFIIKSVMEGVHAAHNQEDDKGNRLGLIHRAINPSNIIITYSGEIKICDFGIAKSTLSSIPTKSGIIKGKASYMSPEQAAGKPLDLRTDIFSGGIILYELISGISLWGDGSEIEIMKNARDYVFKPIEKVVPDLSPRLVAIINKALSQKPEDRYATAAEFSKALGIFLKKKAIGYGKKQLSKKMVALFRTVINEEKKIIRSIVIPYKSKIKLDESQYINLIDDAEWEANHIGFSDFINVDSEFPIEVEENANEKSVDFIKRDTEILETESKTENEDTAQEHIGNISSDLNGDTDKKNLSGLFSHQPVPGNNKKPVTDADANFIISINEQDYDATTKTEDTDKANVIESGILDTEHKNMVATKAKFAHRANDEAHYKTNDDSGDFIVTIGNVTDSIVEIKKAPSSKIVSKNIKVQDEETLFEGEFIINLAELKEELDSDSKPIDATSTTDSENDDEIIDSDDLIVEEEPEDNFVINLSKSNTLAPSRNSISTTMSGEFNIDATELNPKQKKNKDTETIQIDISMLKNDDKQSDKT